MSFFPPYGCLPLFETSCFSRIGQGPGDVKVENYLLELLLSQSNTEARPEFWS